MKSHCLARRCICTALCLLLIMLPVSVFARENSDFLPIGSDSAFIHLLLIGQDRREEKTPARADSIILCSFSPQERRIVITSFPRDLYVPIPGHDDNRLNAAYAFGGMTLLRQTMEENLCLQLDGCIEADFSRFPQIIDTLGGVSIELRQDEAEAINAATDSTLTEGISLLTGDQALAYSRIRNLDSDGDLSRTARQRRLISSLLDSYRNCDLLTVLSVVVDMLPMVNTDLSKRQILLFAAKLFPLLNAPDVTSQRLPEDGSFSYDTIRGMSVIMADPDSLCSQLHQSLQHHPDIPS